MKKISFLVLISMLFLTAAGCSPNSPVQLNTPDPNAEANTPVPNSQVTVPGLTIQVNAPGPNPQANTPNELGRVAGIWMGIWHGFIAPVTLVISFFNENVQMYEVHNDGSQYNLGFLLGLIIFCGVLALLGRRRRKS